MTGQEPRAGFPLTMELAGKKWPKRSWFKINQTRTLSLKRLGKKIGRASAEENEGQVKCRRSLISRRITQRMENRLFGYPVFAIFVTFCE